MAFNINDIRNRLKDGGARPTLFEVSLTFPVSVAGDPNGQFTYTCKAAQIPGLTVGSIQVPYFGRAIKLAGDRTFEPWTTTVINNEGFTIRKALEEWHNKMNKIRGDSTNIRDSAAETYADVTVKQYGKTGSVIRSYKLINAWPLQVDPIALAWESRDQIEEYGVTWEYDFFEVL